MALMLTGLEVPTYEETLQNIVDAQKEHVDNDIDVSDDTSLGQVNKIFSTHIRLANELLQDIYDQRSLENAEGKALDDNVSWLGLRRQGSTPTTGTQYFLGEEGTVITAGSLVRNTSTKDLYRLVSSVTLSRDSCREATISIKEVDDQAYMYTISVRGIFVSYESQAGDTRADIAQGLVLAINSVSDGTFSSTLVGTDKVSVVAIDAANPRTTISVSLDLNLKVDTLLGVGEIACTKDGSYSAQALAVSVIVTPRGGWVKTYNPRALTRGREVETDLELKNRAKFFRSSAGKATIDTMKAALYNVAGVSSVAINERKVSQYVGATTVVVETVADETLYTLSIDDDTFTILSPVSATKLDIATLLVSEINKELSGYGRYYAELLGSDGLTIKSKIANSLVVLVDPKLSVRNGQPAGSIQVVVSGGVSELEVAKAIWDTKPAGVEVWAVNGLTYFSAEVKDAYQKDQLVVFNRPTPVTIEVSVTYKIFDLDAYPDSDATAKSAITSAILEFGRSIGSGQNVQPSKFEGSVYSAVSGIYGVVISMETNTQTASSNNPEEFITLSSDQDPALSVVLVEPQ